MVRAAHTSFAASTRDVISRPAPNNIEKIVINFSPASTWLNSHTEQLGVHICSVAVCACRADQCRDNTPSAVRIAGTQISVGSRIEIRGADHRKILNIHRQDSEQSESAQYVDADDALSFADSRALPPACN
jgi:hypothetical protein